MIASSPLIFLVPNEMKAQTMSEFIALAKSNPGGLNYGSTGQTSSNRVVTEKLQSETGIRMVHVPYADSAPIHTAIMRGDVHFYADAAFRQQFEARGMVVSTRTGPAEMAKIIADDRKRWGAMLAPLNIVLD